MIQTSIGTGPAAMREATVMTVWPSIALYPSGRWLGRMYDLRWPDWHIVRLGHLAALLSIPWALVLYLLRVAPRTGIRYTLTNRRISIRRGLQAVESAAIALSDFDTIDIVVEPGQAWFQAGDLAFCQEGREVFRLAAVPRPEAFRQVCLKTRVARVAVDRACQKPVTAT
jgi:hypothetical protein